MERYALEEGTLGPDRNAAGRTSIGFLPTALPMRRWISTTQDRVLLDAIAFLLAHKGLHSKWLAISHARLKDDLDSPSLLDLSFVTHKWWPLVTGNKDRVASVSCLDQSSPPGSQRSAASAQELGAWRLHRLTTKTVEFSFTNRARFLANGEKNASARTDPFPGQAHIYDVLAT